MVSVHPIPCGNHSVHCLCYYTPDHGNVFNCSAAIPTLKSLPIDEDFPNLTNWVDFSCNKISSISGSLLYLKSISGLNMFNNSISSISSETVDIFQGSKIEKLDLSENRISVLPEAFRHIRTLRAIKLSGNRFICNCDMLWMLNWTIITNFKELNCYNYKDVKIHNLNTTFLGCDPLTLGQKIIIGVSAGSTVAIVIAIIAISRRWNEVKWFMFLHFDILNTNDDDQNVENKQSDALVSYR